MLRTALKAIVLPPLSLYLLGLLGLLLLRRRRRWGRALVALACLLLVLLSVPSVADAMLRGLERSPALPKSASLEGVGAVVVLSAGLDRAGFEYGGPTVGPMTLLRMRYAATLARRTGLPVLTTGGILEPNTQPVASMMKSVLEGEFGVAVRWAERRSRNTRENAMFSAEILRGEGIARVLLVTQSWHMLRSLAEFEATGLSVIPAPCGFTPPFQWEMGSFVPSARSLERSRWAIHEWLGRAWYTLTRE